MSRVIAVESVEMIVPVIKFSEIENLSRKFIYLCLSGIIMFGLLIAVKLLRFNSNNWTIFYIYQTMFGIPTRSPRSPIEKLIYLTMALVSIKYLTDTMTLLTDNKIIEVKEVSFNALEQLASPKLPMYANKAHYQNVDNSDMDESTRNIMTNVAELAEKKDRFCLLAHDYAGYFLSVYRNPDKTPLMKIAGPSFHHDFLVFAFERASPLIEKFNEKLQTIIESGIRNTWKVKKDNFNDLKERKVFTFIKGDYILELMVVVSAGYIICIVALIVELSIHKCIRKTNEKNNTSTRTGIVSLLVR